MNLYFSIDPPHRWVRIRDREVESTGEAATLADIPLTLAPQVITAVVPGEWVATHHVSVPARSRAKMLAAVPYALEEFLSAEVDDLHFVPVHWKAGEEAIVAVVARNLVSGWIEDCRDAGISVDRIVPDYTLLPMHPATRYTVAKVPGGRLLVRSDDGGGIAFDEGFLDSWLDELSDESVSVALNDEEEVRRLIAEDRDVDARFWDFGSGPDDWLTHKQDNQVNLLTGEFRQKSQNANLSGFRIAIILVACAVGIKVLGDAWLYISLSAESGRLDRQMARTIMDTFPDVTNVIPSREQFIMQQEMDKLQGVQFASGDYLLFLSAVARATQGSNVTVEDLTYRDGKLTVSCTVSDFGAVDKLQQKFAGDDRVSVDLASSSASEGRVTGRFVIERAI
jgi:general secretion pathway protein L